MVLRPHLRDEYGNPASVSEGALQAVLVGPNGEEGGVLELGLKKQPGLGAYEVGLPDDNLPL